MRWLLITIIFTMASVSFYSFKPDHPLLLKSPVVELALSHGHCNLLADTKLSSVDIDWSKADQSDVTIDFEMDMARIATFSEQISNHLKSAAVFNVEENNHIVFDCRDNFKLGKNWYQLRGDLTINSVTNPVRLMMRSTRYYSKVKGKRNDKYVISGEVNLFDYGIEYTEGDGKKLFSKEKIMYFNIELLKGDNC
ncbi:MAG: YceI family protein [Flavobacteriales bacterium]|nr:YceI family protein [Flavobacteriales bacterium]